MFVVLLRIADRTQAPRLMDGHKAWIERGIADGVFLVVGSLQPNAGGAILAHGATRQEIEDRVQQDPFVEGGVVRPEIFEIAPNRADERLSFLLA